MRVVSILVFGIVTLGALPSSDARSMLTCGAWGTSDGVSAEAIATCLVVPHGVVPRSSAGCPIATFDLVVADDTTVAVFPSEVVIGYGPALDSSAAAMDGSANNYGTVIDVLGFGDESAAVGPALNPNAGQRQFSRTGRWWRRVCWEPSSADGSLLQRTSSDGPYPEGDVVELSALVATARTRLNPPEVPVFEHSGPASVMQVPTWFWANEAWWTDRYRAEQSHGRVRVVVAAVPTRWEMAALDGPVLARCSTRGEVWRRGRSSSDGCTHTFVDPVDGGMLTASFTVAMDVVWGVSISGYGLQSLAPLYRTVVQDHQVVEVVGLRSGSAGS